MKDVFDPVAFRGCATKYRKVTSMMLGDGGYMLDRWYFTELPYTAANRSPPHLKLSELQKLMQWKLKRGKHRPRLAALVAQNSSASVEAATEKAFKCLVSLPAPQGIVLFPPYELQSGLAQPDTQPRIALPRGTASLRDSAREADLQSHPRKRTRTAGGSDPQKHPTETGKREQDSGEPSSSQNPFHLAQHLAGSPEGGKQNTEAGQLRHVRVLAGESKTIAKGQGDQSDLFAKSFVPVQVQTPAQHTEKLGSKQTETNGGVDAVVSSPLVAVFVDKSARGAKAQSGMLANDSAKSDLNPVQVRTSAELNSKDLQSSSTAVRKSQRKSSKVDGNDQNLVGGKQSKRTSQLPSDADVGEKSGARVLVGEYYPPEVMEGILEAVKEVSVLKGVGVATASAILGILDSRVPFMSDELLLAIGGKPEYTVAAYKRLMLAVGDGVQVLWKGGIAASAQDVERVAFVCLHWDKVDGDKEKAMQIPQQPPKIDTKSSKNKGQRTIKAFLKSE